MGCPRCCFPSPSEPCVLCGLTNFDAFELARYDESTPRRFEFTLVIPRNILSSIEPLLSSDTPYRTTSERRPRSFIFFPDGMDRKLVPVLERLRGEKSRWELLVNGRPRPYTEELWLPLLELLAPVE